MRKLLKGCCIALIIALLLPTIILPADAAEIDETKSCEFTVACSYMGQPISGMEFNLYYVARVTGSAPVFTVSGDFAGYPIATKGLNVDGWNLLALTLKGYVQSDGLKPVYSGTTGTDGTAVFSSVPTGLYLVIGNSVTQGDTTYSAAPFLVCLPGLDRAGGDWTYSVTSSPKVSRTIIIPVTPVVTTVSRRVLKIWDDDGYEACRPESITVSLLRDGDLYSTATLNEQNSWRHVWDGLPSGHDWTIVEESVEGYTVVVEREGVTFVLTNTYEVVEEPPAPPEEPPEPPEEPVEPPPIDIGILPQTGQYWWPVLVLAAGGLLLVLIGIVILRAGKHEK